MTTRSRFLRLALGCAVPALVLVACAQDPAETADTHGADADAVPLAEGSTETFGAPLAATPVVLPAAEALRRADELAGQEVAVEGTVAEVCQSAGCWLTFQTDGPTFRVAVPRNATGQYAFTFPTDVSGARVTIAGTLTVEDTSVETRRHLAEDEGRPAAEVEAITEPERTVILTATGARVDRTPAENA